MRKIAFFIVELDSYLKNSIKKFAIKIFCTKKSILVTQMCLENWSFEERVLALQIIPFLKLFCKSYLHSKNDGALVVQY